MSEEELDALIQAVGVPAGEPDAPLDLDSLQVVTLVDLLEETLREHDLMLGSAEVTRENFATRRSLLAMLRAKGIPAPSGAGGAS